MGKVCQWLPALIYAPGLTKEEAVSRAAGGETEAGEEPSEGTLHRVSPARRGQPALRCPLLAMGTNRPSNLPASRTKNVLVVPALASSSPSTRLSFGGQFSLRLIHLIPSWTPAASGGWVLLFAAVTSRFPSTLPRAARGPEGTGHSSCQGPESQWVLAFEIFIPLVLFFILLGLRQKKPTISVKEVSFYTAAPLTSAGILPVMQSLCPDGQRDEFGFLQYANSTVTQLLERLNRVVEEGNLFDRARPSLGLELEALRQHLGALGSGPGTWESHSERPAAFSFSLDSVARDPRELWRFLMQNLSLPNSTAQALLAARVDPPEVYRLLFGPLPALDSESGLPRGQKPWGRLGSNPLLRMEELLLGPDFLEELTCAQGSEELGRILTVPEGQQAALQGYQDAVCSGQAAARTQRFSELATELRDQLDVTKIAQQLGLDAPNGSDSQQTAPPPRRLQALLGGSSASGPSGVANGTGTGAGAGAGAGSSSNATAEESAPSGAASASPDTLQGQCSAFVQLWAGLQPILCGNNR
ncbi:PREDICTED: ATP-binding cassette sub-family A member 2-like [Galeopterus variegatus]|uniref:ATP-binding cassette sub-family A member 2-like n=1 Tax=Galeopterus variegatus TaxID=482537 RepID=A0ABM0R293_GALVR|nr:PREDICTED: ATP-binding cassette sub-family A member 2-like [Galeopterus variegatus]